MTTKTDFYLVYDMDGNVVGDMDQEAARDRYNDEIGNDEFVVRKIVIDIPEAATPKLTLDFPQAAVA